MQAEVMNAVETTGKTDERAGKYLTFQLAREEFGIRVLKVREIMGIQDITAVPHTPDYVKGVINLRGKVIPVLDLRLKFGLPAMESFQICMLWVSALTYSATFSLFLPYLKSAQPVVQKTVERSSSSIVSWTIRSSIRSARPRVSKRSCRRRLPSL